MKTMASRGPQTSTLASSSSSSLLSEFEWDVFISFSGKDTRNGFTGHLYEQLDKAGVWTFIDTKGLDKGEPIEKLLESIRRSKVFIAVFSESYAESKWCLMELTEMLKCERLLLPVFFHIDPTHVRNQIGRYRKPFKKHVKKRDRETVTEWREALRKAAGLSGFDIATMADGHEATLIQDIVGRVLKELDRIPLDVAAYAVGLKSRVAQVVDMLDMEAKKVQMIGIHGMGGIGKTTLAKAVYNQIFRKFDGSVFIPDVKDAAKQFNGLASMQNQMICDILKDTVTTVRNVDEGKRFIQQRFRGKKVLIVLDDVDNIYQLDALVGRKSWLHESSRVIITTRDKHILTGHDLDENKIYKVEQLDDYQSLQLFHYHAFRERKGYEGFADLSKEVVRCTCNLPLALEVLGKYLFDKRDAKLWKDTLKRLEKCPNGDITGRLRISYDGLKEDERQVFLDLACVFERIDREYATYIWEACDFEARIIIRHLTDKALIKINIKGELEMHDLLQEMGKNIVRQENSSKPLKRTRLWEYSDILSLLEGKKKCKQVEGISIDANKEKETVKECLTAKAFVRLPNLRLLRINHADFNDNHQHLRMKLKWLEWKGCPLNSLPLSLDLQSIVVLDLSNGRMESINTRKPTEPCNKEKRKLYDDDHFQQHQGHSGQIFQELKVLNLKGCMYLTTTPNFASAPNVVKLVFDGCNQLVEIDESIGNLNKLVYLSMRHCENLRRLPKSINRLVSLEVFILEGCTLFSTLPEQLEGMKALKELDLRGTGVKSIPACIGWLTNLEKLLLRNCNSLVSLPESVMDLINLQKLDLRNCKSLVPLPILDDSAKSLTRLCLLKDFITQDYQIDFDVLMNFSEEEAAKDLADRLYHALRNKGIRVFMDQEISKGVKEQTDAIERSEILIPIFSKEYAKSTRCLMDIAKMVDCKRLIIPIFLDIDQLDVRLLRGPYEKAFASHEEDKALDETTVNRWRAGVKEAALAAGYHFNLQENWRKNKQIEDLTERVFGVVNKLPLDFPKHTVGIDSRVDDVLKMLSVEINDVRMIGIHGMGGIGKTTLAKVVYNHVHRHFEGGSCFLPRVRRACTHVGGLVSLQATLVHNISKSEVPPISDVQQGIAVIRQKIRDKKVLIVLDDIDDVKQLDALAGDREWFGLGSRIIITTRDRDILYWNRKFKHPASYALPSLSRMESLELLRRHAFMTDSPKEKYQHLERVAYIAGGVPLIIEIVGSHLSVAFDEMKWMDILEKLELSRNKDIFDLLRVIYDELEENEKEIFLDAACFLNGKDTEDAIYMWKDCGYLPHTEEPHRALLGNPLININARTNKFEMHDLVEHLGKWITSYDGCRGHVGKQSRLRGRDIKRLGRDESLARATGIAFDRDWTKPVAATFLGKLSNLRLLHMDYVKLKGDLEYMPKDIKWLQWRRCPEVYLPSHFSLEKLVILDLAHSSLKQVWQGNRNFPKLKVLNLSGCTDLVECPDFVGVPCLEKLVLDHCHQLPAVNESVGCLQSLVRFTASNCHSLRSLPENICCLQSLRVLKIDSCKQISSLPLQMEKMKSLEELDISFTSIKRIPYSLGCLANLKTVNVTGCKSILASMSSVD